VFEGSAANVKKYLGQFARKDCDRIVSGLSWASFSDDLQSTILNAAFDSLKKGGKFLTFAHYPFSKLPRGKRFKYKLLNLFSEVRVSKIVWSNLPPAFVYVCVK